MLQLVAQSLICKNLKGTKDRNIWISSQSISSSLEKVLADQREKKGQLA